MNKNALSLSLLLTISPAIMAERFPAHEPISPVTHHQATSAGIGLVIGSIAAGPIGAVIGGSMGVLVGDQQTNKVQIAQQNVAIEQLENELQKSLIDLDRSQQDYQTSQQRIQTLKNEYVQQQQHYRADIINIANSYQFDVYFTTNSSLIQQQATFGLNKLATLLENNPHIHANIEAHSDWRGTDDDNCRLATQRLAAVSNHLIQSGSPAEQLLTTSYGEQANINHGSWGEELFYDRRVTITLSYFD